MSKSFPLPDFSAVVRMTVQDVINWLSENKLNDSIKKFRQAGVDGNKLVHITATDLRNINVSKSDSKIILDLVSRVPRPNDRRGGHNNFHTVEQVSDPESDDGGWDEDEFDDIEDGVHTGPRAQPNNYTAVPRKPVPKKRCTKQKDDFQTPVAPPRPNRGRGGPLPPPPGPANPPRPQEKRRVQTPPQQEEEYEDPDQSRYPSHHRDPSPQETYEDPDSAPIPPRSRNGRPPPPMPQPNLPTRGRPPVPVPTQQYPDTQETYEDVDQDPAPAPPLPRQRGRLPSPPSEEEPYEDINEMKACTTKRDEIDSHIKTSQTKPEDYEQMVDEPPPPPRSRPKPPPPQIEQEDYEPVDEHVRPAPARTPTLPSRPNLPPTPRVPVHEEETYEIPDTEPVSRVRLGSRHDSKPVPVMLPQRPPVRKPNTTHDDSDSGDDYVEPDPKAAPPTKGRTPLQQAAILPVRRNTPPPIKRDKIPPKPEENQSKRTLPPPPGVPGYNKIEVSAKGTPVLVPDIPAQPRKASSENSEGYLEGQKFFHGEISRTDAETKLRQHNVDGMYLIRKSTKNPNQPFTLQMYYQSYIYNLPVQKAANGRYTISNEKSKEFQTIREMVNHFKQHKLILKGGKETLLKESLPKS